MTNDTTNTVAAVETISASSDELPPGTLAVFYCPAAGGWRAATRDVVVVDRLDRMAEQDGHPRRTLPLLAAGGGFITLVEVPSGQPVPAPVLSPHRMLVWMHDDDGDGPAAFPDAAELLASVSHVLIVDAMRTDELVYATASGLAACLNRVVLVETTAGCIAAWRAVAERCVTGRVVVALDMD